ncbi:hypothetical protein H0R92_12305 [Treponema sp. OMZ 840]|uniref:hypothetical protein n=1 Tax=Treponema sp. OMZ 840 TaxID=244313 RepID=UPI003D8B4E3E
MKQNKALVFLNVLWMLSILLFFTGCPQSTGSGGSPNSPVSDRAGIIVLKDGTFVEPADYTAFDAENPPLAILIGTKDKNGKAIAIALHSGTSKYWAKTGTTGYTTKFDSIVCTPSATGPGTAATATFTGDTDGSDNWSEICNTEPAGTANAAENYPAFHWVNTYNTSYAAVLAGATPAWYMPSLAELCDVYKNKDAINASLAKIKGLNSAAADSSLKNWYWASSQNDFHETLVWSVAFSNAAVETAGKANPLSVCCLAAF